MKSIDSSDVKNEKILSRVKDDRKYKARLVVKGCQQRRLVSTTMKRLARLLIIHHWKIPEGFEVGVN